VASGRLNGAAEHHWLAAEREILDAPQTALAAQSPMVKKSRRAPRAAGKAQVRR